MLPTACRTKQQQVSQSEARFPFRHAFACQHYLLVWRRAASAEKSGRESMRTILAMQKLLKHSNFAAMKKLAAGFVAWRERTQTQTHTQIPASALPSEASAAGHQQAETIINVSSAADVAPPVALGGKEHNRAGGSSSTAQQLSRTPLARALLARALLAQRMPKAAVAESTTANARPSLRQRARPRFPRCPCCSRCASLRCSCCALATTALPTATAPSH